MAKDNEIPAADNSNDESTEDAKKARVFRLYSEILEKHPGSWLIAGIALLVISTGSIRWGRFSLDLSQSMTPLLRGCFIILGVFLFLLGCFLIVNTQIANKAFLTMIFASVWIVFVGITFYTIGSSMGKSDHAIVGYGYSYEDKAFGVRIKPSALKNYSGNSFVLVVRKKDDNHDPNDDDKIAVSEIHHVPDIASSESDIECKCEKIATNIKPGDEAECHLIIVPNDINLESAHKISDILKYGGKEISVVGNRATPDPTILTSLVDCFNQLSENDKSVFKKTIGLELKPQ